MTSAVQNQLTASCTECSSDTIDQQSFTCHSETTVVTYVARLEGTSQTASSALISLIEDWVSGEPGFSVTGILLTVNPQCSVAILSLSDSECSPPTTTEPPTTVTDDPTPDTMPSTNSTTMPTTEDPSATDPQSSTNNTTAIIGGVVAIVIILIIAISVVIIAALILKHRRGSMSIKEK